MKELVKRAPILLFQLYLGMSILLTSCENRSERTLRLAASESSAGHFRSALSYYENSLNLSKEGDETGLKAAREGARIAFFEVKDFQRALVFYRYLVYNSSDAEEALVAQRQIVAIYFEHLADYEKSILESGKLLHIEKDPVKKVEDRVRIARAYYHLNRFLQARFEIEEATRLPKSSEREFELKLLKANILTADKKYSEAIGLMKELLSNWRERSIKENVPTNLAACYEETKDFKSAIALLESIRSEHAVPEYIELRLKHLRERQKNAPLAKGFRK